MTTNSAPSAYFDAAPGAYDDADGRDEQFEVPYFWRGPFARETYREFGYILTRSSPRSSASSGPSRSSPPAWAP